MSIQGKIAELEKFYDKDDYKGGLKKATNYFNQDQKNGTFLAFQALFNHKLKQGDPADLINKAIRLDMKNPVSWKISGIINKDSGDYKKALQSFTLSYNINKEDKTVLNELIHLTMMNKNTTNVSLTTER